MIRKPKEINEVLVKDYLVNGNLSKHDKRFDEIVYTFKTLFPNSNIGCSWCNRHQIVRSLKKYYGIN